MRRIAFLLFAIMLAAGSFAATASAPTSVQLTIYNQNFALVKEDRDMTLNKGMNEVSLFNVASTIEPSSVAFKSLTDPNAIVVREQNYQYDLINPNTILTKSLGKRVRITNYLDGTAKVIEGTIINMPDNGLVIQTDTGFVLNPSGEIQVMEMPQGLHPAPTLAWKLESDRTGPQKTELSYLADNITWQADYVAVVDPLDKFVDLTGWVTLDNKSGATYENASLNLMAGDVHRVQPPDETILYAERSAPMAAAPPPQFTEKAFFEYHLYTLKDKTTVRDKESKQISLLTAAHIPAKKIYSFDGAQNGTKVNVRMEIVNSQANNLGMPLPKGKVRVYQQDTDGSQQFIGEDMIDHTPKDEKVRLYLGDAFDIVGERKQSNMRQISDHEREESYEITLRNHKDLPVTIVVVEHIWGDWKITQNSTNYNKKDATTVEFPVEVPANGEVTVTYTDRIKW